MEIGGVVIKKTFILITSLILLFSANIVCAKDVSVNDNKITRVEFITLINKTFGFTELSNQKFKDVSEKDLFKDEVEKAVKAGYVSGYVDGKFRPNNYISRQEVSMVLSKLMRLEDKISLDRINIFKDKNKISKKYKNSVNSVVEKGYMNGYDDETFKPNKDITKPEANIIIKRVVGTVYNKPGTFGPVKGIRVINGNVTINRANVNLRNIEIKGDLYLTAGVGDGNVKLENVKVSGRTIICGGGEHSIIIRNSSLGITIIDKSTGNVRILATGSTTIGTITLRYGATLEESEITGDGFQNVSLDINIPQGETVQFEGEFGSVIVDASNINVQLLNGSIENLSVNENTSGSTLTIEQGTTVNTLNLDAPIDVVGQGQIENANITSDGVRIEQTPDNVDAEDNTNPIIGGQQTNTNTQTNNGGGGGSIVYPASIESINGLWKIGKNSFYKNIYKDTNYSLPIIAIVKMNNGVTTVKEIIWNPQTVDITKGGTYNFVGKISGYNENVLLQLKVEEKQEAFIISSELNKIFDVKN